MTQNVPNLPESKMKKDEIPFAEEDNQFGGILPREPWKILIADDEKEIHHVTRLVLRGVTYKGRNLQFIDAYSAKEALDVMKQNPDVAIILLDVVMEKDDAGLNIIHTIRDDLNNRIVRIIIRTGQPGQAPEKKVIIDYDINDYREKTELTSQKLFSTVIASLRSYENILAIELNRKGLEKIIEASARLFEIQSAEKFTYEALEQLRLLLVRNKEIPLEHISGFVADVIKPDNPPQYSAAQQDVVKHSYVIRSAAGKYKNNIREQPSGILTPEIIGKLDDVVAARKISHFDETAYIGFFKSKIGHEHVIYLESEALFDQSDKYLMEILGSNISSIFDNIYITREIEDTQKEILYTLGEVVETRSQGTFRHVKHVAEYCSLLGLKYGLNQEETELLKQASPLHDIGKVGIIDAILNKPAPLSDQEFAIIKTHTTIGYNIFKTSDRRLLKAAAIIALQHHEHWDGTGYPRGMKGEEIHIFGRISCLADNFDSLGHDRVYQDAWPLDRILAYIKEQKGKFFDPKLVDIFFDNLDDILQIRQSMI